jgi:hypothetical protein
LDTPSEVDRKLHAKAFEILCRDGRLVVSGSANGTTAALTGNGNVEACVLRIQRNNTSRWKWIPAEPPEPQVSLRDKENELNKVGVLRAELRGDHVIGQVLTPRMSGEVSIHHIATVGPELLAETAVDSEGAFSIIAPDLERWSWRGGRLVLRLTDRAGRQAEGFVSLASFGEIVRRAGAITPRLLALILGTETPADVSAMLSWFLEDPRRLSPVAGSVRSGSESEEREDTEQLVPVAVLDAGFGEEFRATTPNEIGGRHWTRFLDQVLAAFRETRGPFGGVDIGAPGDDDEDEPSTDRKKPSTPDRAVDATYAAFTQLFEILTRNGSSPRNAEIAFDLTGFICARLRPDIGRARAWLESVIRTWMSAGVRAERREDVAAAILTLLGMAPDVEAARRARNSLLSLGRDLSTPPPSSELMHNYQTVLLQQENFAELWARARDVRTYQEQVQAYLTALQRGEATPDAYADLPAVAPDTWPVLAKAFTSPQTKRRLLFVKDGIDACPRHYTTLPMQEIDKLRSIGIATAKNCCGGVVIRKRA